VEEHNIGIERRYAVGQRERLPTLAVELVQLNVDLIVVAGNSAAQATQQATRSIPIAVTRGGDLVGTGLVASLARPGGNVIGVSGFAVDLSGKQLELLKEAIPTLPPILLFRADEVIR
jgi:putative tryptophan/tyrosine transport system substrate-binding protein